MSECNCEECNIDHCNSMAIEDYKKRLTKEQKWDYMFNNLAVDCKKCMYPCTRSYCRNPQSYKFVRGLYQPVAPVEEEVIAEAEIAIDVSEPKELSILDKIKKWFKK